MSHARYEDASVKAYFESLTSGCGAAVRAAGASGYGLFATAAPEGEPPVVLSDSPLGGIVQRRFGGQQSPACALCGHALGSVHRHLQRLSAQRGTGCPPASAAVDPAMDEPLSDLVAGLPLFSAKRPVFCSGACREAHERYFGCLRRNLAATRQFVKHAQRCQCAFYVLALKLICWALAEAAGRGAAWETSSGERVVMAG
mmetsp:Transcript_42912/g.134009  ORF Transcript_42912/g.134009 Transcript_42912/m.134009 type:complete len:200 (+) Transcript_42912:101-700(+)